jgi:glutamyl-tRNA reductase
MRAAGDVRGGVMLATCNRLEFVVDLPSGGDRERVAGELFQEDADLPRHIWSDAEATHYLLRVATGLESMVLGEDQILGQLREAFKQGEQHGMLSPTLQVLRTRLVSAARDTRRLTGLAGSKVSVAALAARELAKAGPRLAVVGAGETGRLAVETLRKCGRSDVMVVNRTLSRASALARHFGTRAMGLDEFLAAAESDADSEPRYDGVLFAIRSPKPLFTARHARGLRQIVDISMPSVVAADVRTASGTEVLDLDGIAALVEAEGVRRSSGAGLAGELVQARAQELHRKIRDVESGQHARLAAVVDHHLETALAELQAALASNLRHLSEIDRQQVRQVIVRAAKRNAHYHLEDLRASARP